MFDMKKIFFILFTLVFLASGDITNKDTTNSVQTPGDDEFNINKLEGNIPAGIEKIMGLPEISEGEDMLRERCDKNGNNESFANAMIAREEFEKCVTGLVDINYLKAEINKAKPTGDLDSVFKKYCRKTPIVKGCIADLLKGMESCFAENERSQVSVVQNVTDSLMNFICFKEGDRIALFIAEGGPECLTSKVDAVQQCVNSTVTSATAGIQGKNISEEIPEIVFDSEKCGYFTQAQKCVVQVLEECSEPTPANIVGSLFDFVRKSTPCSQYYSRSTSGSTSLTFSIMSLLVPIGAIFLSKI